MTLYKSVSAGLLSVVVATGVMAASPAQAQTQDELIKLIREQAKLLAS